MKLKKSLISLLLLTSLVLSGCNYEAIIDSIVRNLPQQMTEPGKPVIEPVEPFIGFAETDVESVDDLLQLKPEELQNYTSRYSKYSSYYYFEYLNDTEKLVYHAYEYALDEGMPYFWVDDRLLQGLERDTFEILELLSLDSAVVEQNIACVKDSQTVFITGETYTTFFVQDFTKQRLKNKDQAIMDAKIVMSRLYGTGPHSQRELAEYIYNYLGGCIRYQPDIDSDEYLYAGLCEGATNCDGYTNAVALMCSLVDVPCIEINSITPQGEVGHTWNMVNLDGIWVHLDASGAGEDIWSLCDSRNAHWIYFGFPDDLLTEQVIYANWLPSCPVGLTPMLHFRSQRDETFIRRIAGEFESNNREFAVVLLDEGDMDEQTVDELVAELNCSLYYVHYETAEGKCVYYLFNDN